ncbi:MAG: hypothetical protein MJZ66_02390 [Bacteroidales bacterium]|nr:hypothetical protein [Bacteroidales bacterium]
MFIDNTPSTSKWTLAEVLTFTISVALMLWAYLERSDYTLSKISICGMSVFQLANILAYIGLAASVLMLLINPSYVYYNDEGKNIVIRTCSAFPLFRNYREFPFPKSSLVSYNYTESIFGWKKVIDITVSGLDPNTKQPKEMTIEGINVSALKKDNIDKLKKALDKILEK